MATIYHEPPKVGGEGSILSFAGGVFIAKRQITQDGHINKDATLYEVACTPSENPAQPKHKGTDLSQLTVTCRNNGGHITITDKGWWSTWEPAVVSSTPIIGNSDVGWDAPDKLGLEEAAKLVLAAENGGEGGFFSASLQKPQHPGNWPVQPYYIFKMALEGQNWWVGVDDKKVYKPGQ